MNLRRYSTYKSSTINWAGAVPNDWEIYRLRDTANLINGYPFDSSLFGLGDGLPLVRIRDIRSTTTETSWTGAPVESARINRGDILVGMDGDFNVARWSGDSAMLNQRVCCVRADEARLDSRFLFYFLPFPLTALNDVTYSTTVKHLSSLDLLKFRFYAPTLRKQRAIADFLDRETARLDTLVGKKRELIEKLKEKRTALISRTVTRGLPPAAAHAAGLNPNPKLKLSGIEWLSDIPEHWKVKLLKRIENISYGVGGEIDRSLESGLKTLSLPNIDIEGRLSLDDVPFADVSEAEKRKVLLRNGDLLFNWRNGSSDHLGKTAYFQAQGEFSHVSFLLRLRFNPARSESRFFQRLIAGYRATRFFSHSKAGVNNTFNMSELASLPVICPPTEEQRAIAEYLDHETAKLDRLMEKVAAALEKLQEYRTALITAAVTGKIDVRNNAG